MENLFHNEGSMSKNVDKSNNQLLHTVEQLLLQLRQIDEKYGLMVKERLIILSNDKVNE